MDLPKGPQVKFECDPANGAYDHIHTFWTAILEEKNVKPHKVSHAMLTYGNGFIK